MANEYHELYEAIIKHFNESELKELCFYLSIEIGDLPGNTYRGKVRELILYSKRQDRFEYLIKTIQKKREQIDWYELANIKPKPRAFHEQLPPDIDDILEAAKEIAKKGGERAKEYFADKENIPVDPEIVKNFTTLADKRANEVIVNEICVRFPKGHHIIAEEGGTIEGEPKEQGYTWVIDAIDGTINFFHQLPIFCTAVGILWNRKPVAGVIFNPISQELFFAKKTGGAYRRLYLTDGTFVDKKLLTNQETRIRDAVVMTHLSSRRYARERLTNSGLLDALSNASRSIRALGSGQVSLAYIAQSKFHAFVNNMTHSWDQVAGLVIVEEAGGVVTNFRGGQWTLDSESIVAAANQELHNQLTAIITAIYPFEGPIHRLGVLLRNHPGMESKLIKFIKSYDENNP